VLFKCLSMGASAVVWGHTAGSTWLCPVSRQAGRASSVLSQLSVLCWLACTCHYSPVSHNAALLSVMTLATQDRPPPLMPVGAHTLLLTGPEGQHTNHRRTHWVSTCSFSCWLQIKTAEMS
jgi:hypothetical protein